jgi:hypothetical protein
MWDLPLLDPVRQAVLIEYDWSVQHADSFEGMQATG